MADAVMSGPVGDDWQPVVAEVMRYWQSWVLRSGNSRGAFEASSEWFDAESVMVDPSVPVEGVDPEVARSLPEGVASLRGFSDYEDHRVLMDAGVPELRVLMAMMLARGIRLGGVS